MNRSLYEMFLDAEEQIDYEKIHRVMTILDWKWVCGDATFRVPRIDEMKSTVFSLFESVRKSELANTQSSTGGFSVRKFTWEKSNTIEIEVAFDLESSHAFSDC